MRHGWTLPLVLAALAIGSIAPAAASEARDDELAGIRRALDRLVQLEQEAGRLGRIELMIRRIELHERRLEPSGERLRRAEEVLRERTDHQAMLERMKAQHEERLDAEIREGKDVPDSETRQMLADIERTSRDVVDRLAAAELHVRELEDRLAAARRTIEILDEQLDELLEVDSGR